MKFNFSANKLKGKEKRLQRFFEIVPGFASWTIIIGMLILAFRAPIVAAVLIIAFDLYWLLRLLYLTLFLICSYFRLSSEKETDWMGRVRGIDSLSEYELSLKEQKAEGGLKEKVSLFFLRREIKKLGKIGTKRAQSKDLYHLVLIPIAKETQDIVEPGLKSIALSDFPPNRIMVVLAVEERADEEIKTDARRLLRRYKGKFFDMKIVVHPDGRVGEAKAKGANATFAAKETAKYFSKKKIPFEHVIVSCFDSDTVVKPDYFASLTYYFQVCPERERASFQPVPVYNNNIWDAPGITRVLETGSSFFQLVEATNPEKLVTFSSHSMSFKALVDAGYWPVDMISDDSAIFWKAFIHFDGKYKVVPMYTTLSMDAVVAENWMQTIKNVYKQKRRWAWGVENFPIVMRAFMKDKNIPLFFKMKHAFKLFEGHIAWATWAFLLTFVGWLPAIFASRAFSHSVLYYSAPRIMGTIFNLASFSLITSIVLSILLLPKKKEKHSIAKRIGYAFEWLLIPFTMVFLSALPSLDAQTRLMFGKYMTFWVTDKKKKTPKRGK
ncbi:MAG: glycosyltransferase family 2 protein [Candidatus Omnitrophica bacterium]|nr:glycosyltransferase family 2 protein [Candidatus Omnitrophota bacterium]